MFVIVELDTNVSNLLLLLQEEHLFYPLHDKQFVWQAWHFKIWSCVEGYVPTGQELTQSVVVPIV